MWEAGPCLGSLSGFWWIFPVIGLLVCLFFVVAMMRMTRAGGHCMCMGRRPQERDELNKQTAASTT